MAEQKNIMSYETVALDDEQSALVILDQTKLPYEVEVLHLTEQKDIPQSHKDGGHLGGHPRAPGPRRARHRRGRRLRRVSGRQADSGGQL